MIDPERGLAYVDATSGEYPPAGFLFGVINVTSHSLIATLPLHVVPGPMALDRNPGDVFVAGNESVEVFRGTSDLGMIRVGHPILGMTYDGNVSEDLFFTSGDHVYAFSAQRQAMVANATVANGPEGLVLDPNNGMLYVSEYLSGEMAVFRASTLAPVATIELPSCCASQLALNPRTQTLYASTQTNLVDVIDAGDYAFERSVAAAPSTGNTTNSIVVDSDTGRVYVASSPGGSILELDSAGSLVGHYKVESQVAGLAIDTKTKELLATDYHQITVFNAAGNGNSLIVVFIGAAVVAVGAALVYLFLRHREEKERMVVQSGVGGPPPAK